MSEMLTRGMSHNRVTRHAYITALGRSERWAEAHTQRPPFTTILEEVTAHHQQACIYCTLH